MSIRTILSATAVTAAAALVLAGCAEGEGPRSSTTPPLRGHHPGGGLERRRPQRRLRDVQPAEPDHQGAGLARGGARRRRPGQLDPVGRVQQGQRGAARRRRRRRRLHRRLGRPPRPRERLAHPHDRALRPAGVVGDRRPGGSDIDSVEDLAGKSVAATKGTDPYFFLLGPRGARPEPGRHRGAEPAARRRPRRARERCRRRLGRAGPAHGRQRGQRRQRAHLPRRRLQHLRLPERDRGSSRRTPTSPSSSSTPTRRPACGPRRTPRRRRRSSPTPPASTLAIAEKVILERTNLDIAAAPGEAARGPRGRRADLRRVR